MPTLMGMSRCFVLALLSMFAWVCQAQQEINRPSKGNAAPETMHPAGASADRRVPLLSRRITLADFQTMKPKPEIENELTKVEGFIQSVPFDGQPATQKTEAWIGRTATALYVVFACWDNRPALIRGHLARRENVSTDDNVVVLLDPFQDRRRGILLQMNPSGVQADAAWTEGNGGDFSYDLIWDSESRIERDGWMALFSIPFRSLRFRPNGGDWGIVLERNLPRNSETVYWPRVAKNVSGILSQEGILHGIEGVHGSHNVQINPYVLGQNEKTLLSLDPLSPYFSSRHAEATAGGEMKAVLKDSIVIDATVNPDFSDVESDQPQFTVNQRYPVYFPELRPFFLENANYFSTPLQLVYTRNIVRPEFGARVTGKIGKTNVGLLVSDDRSPGEALSRTDAAFGKKALFAIGRVAQDVGQGSSIGLIYTDEEFAKGWNRIGGVDFKARFGDHWTVSGQGVESSSQAPTLGGVPGPYSAGPAVDVQVNRNGHSLNVYEEFQDVSAGFVTQVGFLQTANIRLNGVHVSYRWYPKHSLIQSYGVETNDNIAFDHQGRRLFRYMMADPFVTLAGNTVFAPLVGQNSDTVGPQNGYSLATDKNFTENFVGFLTRGSPLSQLSFDVTALRSGNVNYNPVSGTPSLLNQQSLNAQISIKPVRQLTADNIYLLDRNFDTRDGQFVYESQTFRTKVNYQFTRALSARLIIEYDSTLVNALKTSLQRTKQIGTQALLTWLPHPGTAIYIGYNNDLQNLDHAICSKVGTSCDPTMPILPRGAGFLNDGKQIFVKASYLLRL